MTGAGDFAKMVPGFDFLQNLMKGASGGLPQINQWIAPTLDPAELEKRIQDLKTVQFWLEQNTRLLGTTIQALEVQRMTLNTLKTMNLPLADLGAALRVPMPAREPAAAPAPAPAPEPSPPEPASPAPAQATPESVAAKGAVDPLQWWGALTQQFTEIASRALHDSQADSARQAAGQLVQQSINAAQQTFQNTLKQAAAVAQPRAAKTTSTPSRSQAAAPPRAKKAPARQQAAAKATKAAPAKRSRR